MRLTIACWILTLGLRLLPEENRKGFWRVIRCYTNRTLHWEEDG